MPIQFGKVADNGVFANATATIENGFVRITAPPEADKINFYAPVDFSLATVYTVNGVQVELANMQDSIPSVSWITGAPLSCIYEKDEEKLYISTMYGDSALHSAVFINSTAIMQDGVMVINSPDNAELINFITPSDASEVTQVTVNGTEYPLTDLAGSEVPQGWVSGVPISLVLHEDHLWLNTVSTGGSGGATHDLPPLNPNFTLQRVEGENKVIVQADKLTISKDTEMLAGGVWVYGDHQPTSPSDGTVKLWQRDELLTSGKPFDGLLLGYAPAFTLPLTAPIRLLADGTYDLVPEDPALSEQATTYASGDRLQLSGLNPSDGTSAVIVKIPESDGEEHEYLYLSSDYEGTGRSLFRRLVALDTTGNPNNDYAKNGTLKGVIDSWVDEAFPNWVSQNIIPITVPYSYRPSGTSAASGTLGSFEARAFPLSGKEIGGGAIQVDTGDPLPYFSNDSRRIVNGSSGSAVNYWTRDYYGYRSSGGFRDYYVNTNGQPAAAVSGDFNAVPAITLSSEMSVVENEDGTYSLVEPDDAPIVSLEIPTTTEEDPVWVRQYTFNQYNEYQTMLQGSLASTEIIPDVVIDPVFGNNSWEVISYAAQNGLVPDTWQIGDTKDEVIAGETLTFAIMGKNMDDLADGSGKAGLTFGMTQLMASTRQMNSSNTNSGSFAGSAMYSWLSGTIYPNLPAELKDAIKAVNKKTSSGGGSSAIRTDAMYLWLFAEIEVFGTTTYSYAGEGTQYPYFATAAERIKKLSNGTGAASFWLERSPYGDYGGDFCDVTPSGAANIEYASHPQGVCFGFCI